MIKASDYGKSSFGGWYCNFIENGMIDGLHAPTYRELVRKCNICGVTLKGSKRIDN